jgi:hypothetical protein
VKGNKEGKNRSTKIYNENRAPYARCICSRAFSHDDHRTMLFRRARAYKKKKKKKKKKGGNKKSFDGVTESKGIQQIENDRLSKRKRDRESQ